MEKGQYHGIPHSKPYLFENMEERRVIHQFNHRGQETDLDNIKGKYTLNEIR